LTFVTAGFCVNELGLIPALSLVSATETDSAALETYFGPRVLLLDPLAGIVIVKVGRA
jgi:hypothetical protein